MARIKNITIQLNEGLNDIIKIGESRHDWKLTNENNQSPYVHSTSTAKNYREVLNSFAKWIKAERQDIWQTKDLKAIDKDVAAEYLIQRQDEGKSAWTISRDVSAINKVLKLGLNKAEIGLKQRRIADIKRSRGNTNANLSPEVLKENSDQMLLAKATGIRRESVTELTPRKFYINEKGLVTGVRVEWQKNGKMCYEKGGRFRIAPVLAEYRERLTEILKDKDPDKPIFKEYSKTIDNHTFRGEYARARYAEEVKMAKMLGKKVSNTYRGCDPDVARIVSGDLGHNRLDVILYHYLR